jgi:hypothetical protein
LRAYLEADVKAWVLAATVQGMPPEVALAEVVSTIASILSMTMCYMHFVRTGDEVTAKTAADKFADDVQAIVDAALKRHNDMPWKVEGK